VAIILIIASAAAAGSATNCTATKLKLPATKIRWRCWTDPPGHPERQQRRVNILLAGYSIDDPATKRCSDRFNHGCQS